MDGESGMCGFPRVLKYNHESWTLKWWSNSTNRHVIWLKYVTDHVDIAAYVFDVQWYVLSTYIVIVHSSQYFIYVWNRSSLIYIVKQRKNK